MALPVQPDTHHRVLYRLESELPDGCELATEVDADTGVTVHRLTLSDGDPWAWDPRVAADYPAARFSPGDCFSAASWANPADFSPAPALAMKWAGKGGDGGAAPGLLRIEKDADGRVFAAGICYEAGVLDTDGEFFTQPQLKGFAHSLMVMGSRKGDADHDREDREGISLVESSMVEIVKDDDGAETYVIDPEGAGWFVKYELTDPVIKARVELPSDDPNSLTAFSWDGMVRKRVATVTKSSEPVLVTKSEQLDASKAGDGEGVEMYDGRCIRVSLVHRGANRRSFAVAQKSADADRLLTTKAATQAPVGLIERIKAWVGGDSDNPLAAHGSFDEALAATAKHVTNALAGNDPEAAIRDVCKALGHAAALKAREAMTASLNDPSGSWFTPQPRQEHETMTKEEINALVQAAVKEATAPATPEPAKADEATAEDIAEALKAAADAAVQATAEKHAAELAAKDAEIEAAKAAQVAPPQAGGGDQLPPAKTEQAVSFIYGVDMNAAARAEKSRKFKSLGQRE